jgi:hypothetical protein
MWSLGRAQEVMEIQRDPARRFARETVEGELELLGRLIGKWAHEPQASRWGKGSTGFIYTYGTRMVSCRRGRLIACG